MKTENVLYTDGDEVTVTNTKLLVRKRWYNLDGITKHGFSIIQPARLPSFLLIGLGLLLVLTGATKLIDTSLMSADEHTLDPNKVSILIGAASMIMGVIAFIMLRERYAVSITTAEGDKHVVISRRKEYISQIVGALNDAFFQRLQHDSDAKSSREFYVSGR